MPTISEPVLERNEWTYSRIRKAYIDGVIGEKTFEVSLRHLGLAPNDIVTEINLAKMEMREGRK